MKYIGPEIGKGILLNNRLANRTIVLNQEICFRPSIMYVKLAVYLSSFCCLYLLFPGKVGSCITTKCRI